MSIADKLCCEHLKTIEPYQSARRIGGSGEVWLNANESPTGYDDYVIDSRGYERYPEFQSEALRNAYGGYAGRAADQILCVRGADEGIELLIRGFCDPRKDSIVITPPTYGMYQVSADIHHVGIQPVPRDSSFALDVDALTGVADAKLVFLCSPNNPTGNASSHQELVTILEHFKDSALVVVDEAYHEFDPDSSAVPLLDRYENLVVVRTLSKAFALAALRCGFVLAHREVIALLSKILAPYPVPSPVEQIALQALSGDGIERMRERVGELNRVRDDFIAKVRRLAGVTKVTPTAANFVLVEFEDEPRAVELLSAAGVVVRTPYTQGLITDSQRISVGTADQMVRVLTALQQLEPGAT